MNDTITDSPVLRVADRCDRCSGQAYVRGTLLSGSILLCRHHGLQHMPMLKAQCIEVLDETRFCV